MTDTQHDDTTEPDLEAAARNLVRALFHTDTEETNQ